jgi:hypothetical protein
VTSIIGDFAPPPLDALDQSADLRGYTRLRPHGGQPVNFVALLAGLKPVMDDWVAGPRLEEFTAMCRARGLHVVADGTEDGRAAERVHVFLGHDRSAVDRARRAGWRRPVGSLTGLGGRAGRHGTKPWIDHYWFGLDLGYPQCCIRAFAKRDNWSAEGSAHYSSWLATGEPSMLCNPLLRSGGLSWTAHLPCRFDCEETVAAAVAVRAALRRHSLDLADIVDQLAARPYLVVSEREVYCFVGVAPDDFTIVYQGVVLAPTCDRDLRLFEALRAGDRVQVRDDLVVVFDGDEVLWVERCMADGPAPRLPVVLDFSAGGEPT